MDNWTDLEKQIITLIKKSKKNLTKKEIKYNLKIKTEEQISELETTLNDLQLRGLIYLNSYDEFQLFQRCQDLAIGTLKYSSKKEAYVVIGSNHVYIPNNCLNGALVGDLVIVRKNSFKQTQASIDKILRRDKGLMIFDYDRINHKFIPYNWPVPIDLNIPNKQTTNLLNGSRVQIKVSLDKANNAFNGQIVSLIGYKDDPELDVKTIVGNSGIIIDFSKESLEQADKIATHVTKKEIEKRILNNGIDLRNKTIFTIDGKDTKDIDDAVSIERTPNGYKLCVHIADVSYYIPENSILDLEARERSTSVYPYNCVIPMLPRCLSNGICSLNPNEDRMAFSCIMEISKEGEILNYEFVDTIINSKKKMAYDKINDIFEKQIMHQDYEPFIYDLSLMAELSEILSQRKLQRGYIYFEDTEVTFEDELGTAVGVKKRKRGMAEKMIENFMLCANECAASFTYWQQSPGIYRIHPEPNIDKLKATIELFGLKITIPNNIDDPRVLQNIIEKIKRYDSSGVYNELLLQAMNRASYSPDNIGHFGLALQNYTHFTSPIRRYPDLQTHRIIRDTRDLTLEDEIESYKKLVSICEHASKQERLADKAERDVDHYKMAEYMENHIGETFMGFVTYISHNGVSVKTDDFIFGKISFESLKQLGYEYDSEKFKLVNRATGTELFLGDRIEIVVKSANKETYKIEFELKQKIPKQKIKVS